MLLLDFTELLLEATLDDERTELLDRSSTGAEDDERTELLDPIVPSELQDDDVGVTLLLDRSPDEPGMTEEEDSSSSGRTKLLSSSPQAASTNDKKSAAHPVPTAPQKFLTLILIPALLQVLRAYKYKKEMAARRPP